MTARMRPATVATPLWISLVLTPLLADCASRQPDLEKLVVDDAQPVSSERAAVIADIRRKAEESRLADKGSEPNSDESFGLPVGDRRTYAEIKAIEAELDALAEAARTSSNPGELAELRRQADRLEALRRQLELDGEAGSGSIDQ